ncbi:hypothetical protein C8A05DRAFT_45527 [Staphylotrichum tortipilum]|uniref:Uncharacterized protein n=1 Tax=Staphylotrichum tortipilum TaxID=2831512 RepID=A0AAN6MHH2_9PEZI|nr:hypothetical protein C8A05DRAFT_45527 [Staphylotrichum longicolle]
MASFDELFILLPAFRAAVCREHHGTVTAKSAISYIGSYHGHLGAPAEGLLAADVHEIRFPDTAIPAIDGLPVWADGKKCVQCGYIRRLHHHIQQHCRSEHGWVNPRGRGGKPGAGPAGGLGEAWVDGVHCQRFGQTGALQRLFEVVPPAGQGGQGGSGAGDTNSDDNSSSRTVAIRAMIEASDQSRLSANMWVRRTGWPRHLRGFDRTWLTTTTRRPAAAVEEDQGEDDEGSDQEVGQEEAAGSEAALAVTLLAVERVVVGSAAVNFIERREAGGTTNEKPFNAAQKGQTMVKYVEAWKSVMAYIWRTWGLEAVEVVNEPEEEGAEDSEAEQRYGQRDRQRHGQRYGQRRRQQYRR